MSLWLKLGGMAVALAAVWLGLTLFGNSRFRAGELSERVKWGEVVVRAEAGKLEAFKQGLARVRAGETVYRETVRQLPGVVTRIIERSNAYAATPAGAAVCLDPERVRQLDQTRSALFAAADPASAAGGAGAVPAGAPRPQF